MLSDVCTTRCLNPALCTVLIGCGCCGHCSRNHRGKGLAAFLKAIGYLIPLMDNESANYYTREVMVILIREFQSPDEEMKKIVLKVGGITMATWSYDIIGCNTVSCPVPPTQWSSQGRPTTAQGSVTPVCMWCIGMFTVSGLSVR